MKRLLLVAIPMALAACASTPDTPDAQSAEAREPKAYRTGSNIPMRDGDLGPAVKGGDVPSVKPVAAPASRGGG